MKVAVSEGVLVHLARASTSGGADGADVPKVR